MLESQSEVQPPPPEVVWKWKAVPRGSPGCGEEGKVEVDGGESQEGSGVC